MKSQSFSTSKNVTLIIQKYTNNQKELEQIHNLKLNKSQYLTTFSDVHNPLITKGFVAAQCSRRILNLLLSSLPIKARCINNIMKQDDIISK